MWYVASEENIENISHHGILGQKWGIRRYQYEDGSLTPEGRIRYGSQENYERAVRRYDRNVAIAKGVAVGALAGLAIYGGARYLKHQRDLKRQIYQGLGSNYLNKVVPEFNNYTKGLSYDKLKKIQDATVNTAKNSNFSNPRHKVIYDVVSKEIKRRDDMADYFTGKGKKAIAGLMSQAKDNYGKEFFKGTGTALGVATVGAIVATAKQATEQRDRSYDERANEYANYMWPNPNKK